MTEARVISATKRATRIIGRQLPLVALAFSVVINLLMARALLGAQRPAHGLAAGTAAIPFEAETPAGEKVLITFTSERPTILYHFSPTCAWCERNWPNVRALVAETRGRFRFVGVSTAPVSATFIRDRQLPFEVVTNISPATAHRYALGGTPETILISTDQKVQRVWAGAYTGRYVPEIEAAFGIHLPGLASASGAPAVSTPSSAEGGLR